MQDVLALIEVLNEFGDAAAEVELGRALRIFAFIGERNLQALVEEREFAQAMLERAVRRSEGTKTSLVAVTALTSLGSSDLADLGVDTDAASWVTRLAKLGRRAGISRLGGRERAEGVLDTGQPSISTCAPTDRIGCPHGRHARHCSRPGRSPN